MKNFKYVLILGILLLATSCADKTVVEEVMKTHEYGFWGGLWHGLIAPFDLVGSLIWDDVTMYAEHNNGGWYAFGFLLGVSTLVGSSSE